MGDDEAPIARVGIVTWNTADLLDDCLSALPAALDGMAAEVVVVDNASSDGCAQVAARHGVRVLQNLENRGYAQAMNQAFSRPWPPVLVALNPDTVPPPGTLAKLVRDLLAGPPDVALVAPRLTYPDGELQHSVYRFPSLWVYAAAWFLPRVVLRRLARSLWIEGLAPHDRTQDIDWAIGAVHVIRSEALDGRDPYDERWFMYVEDIELCWWLRSRGWRRRLDAEVEVVHIGNASGSQAWGSDRHRRYMEASYDWFSRDAGLWRTRAWALLNSVGSVYFAARHAVLGLRPSAADHRQAARWAVGCVPVHLMPLSPSWRRRPAARPTAPSRVRNS